MTTMHSLPAGGGVEGEGEVTRVVLPAPELGKLRWVGLLVIGFGVFILGFMYFWISGVLSGVNWCHVQGMQWFQVGMAVTGIPGVIGGMMPVGLGLYLLFPKEQEIRIGKGRIGPVVRLGYFRWRPTRRLEDVAELRVGKQVDREERMSRA